MHFTEFLYDEIEEKSKFAISFIKGIRSVFLYNKLIINYKQTDFGSVSNMIKDEYRKQSILIEKNASKYSAVDFQKAASMLIPIYRIFGRFVKQSDLCLERSMALTYALISVGIPVVLVIGKAKYYISDNFSFHAWVELYGQPLNDHDGMHKQWSVIYELPKPNIGI